MNNESLHIYGPILSPFVKTVILLCEEKSLNYTVGLTINGEDVDFKSEQHLKLHPAGKVPILFHNDFVLCETVAICRYLDQAYPQPSMQPEDIYERALHDQWCSILAGEFNLPIIKNYLLEFAFPKGENGQVKMDKIKEAEPLLLNVLSKLNKELQTGKTLGQNRLTIADTLIIPILAYIHGIPHGSEQLKRFEYLQDYIAKMLNRPSCMKLLK
ncbi:glutathione S-transferase family protein [Zooshikella marina]|uniref:glutathione transferase n=1 Tax=Zooshikella ganghwensis TaxID=202772 RepID=A0A4P9VJU3_9GAMM|nr:glutathione S-transferase family protein [Zooshikella ganghwensis]MBU2706113.1 glutathione S-transferase family protein [Zooshikella ganghwensis]RDH42584.1 glutathione S-transferase family protein [Zooshikella ganghwensis]